MWPKAGRPRLRRHRGRPGPGRLSSACRGFAVMGPEEGAPRWEQQAWGPRSEPAEPTAKALEPLEPRGRSLLLSPATSAREERPLLLRGREAQARLCESCLARLRDPTTAPSVFLLPRRAHAQQLRSQNVISYWFLGPFSQVEKQRRK